MLYLSISILCNFILQLHNVPERNIELFTLLHLLIGISYFTNQDLTYKHRSLCRIGCCMNICTLNCVTIDRSVVDTQYGRYCTALLPSAILVYVLWLKNEIQPTSIKTNPVQPVKTLILRRICFLWSGNGFFSTTWWTQTWRAWSLWGFLEPFFINITNMSVKSSWYFNGNKAAEVTPEDFRISVLMF